VVESGTSRILCSDSPVCEPQFVTILAKEPIGAFLSFLELFGAFWSFLELFGAFWSFLSVSVQRLVVLVFHLDFVSPDH
jgi:hypothetical protein